MKELRIIVFLTVLSVLLVNCNDQKVVPNKEMFSVGIDELTDIKVDQPFTINGFLKNESKYSFKINHGADMFRYQVYDENGNPIPREGGMSFVNAVGWVIDLKSQEDYRNNGEEQRSNELYEFSIFKAGKYKATVTAKFTILIDEIKYDQEITSDYYEFWVE